VLDGDVGLRLLQQQLQLAEKAHDGLKQASCMPHWIILAAIPPNPGRRVY